VYASVTCSEWVGSTPYNARKQATRRYLRPAIVRYNNYVPFKHIARKDTGPPQGSTLSPNGPTLRGDVARTAYDARELE